MYLGWLISCVVKLRWECMPIVIWNIYIFQNCSTNVNKVLNINIYSERLMVNHQNKLLLRLFGSILTKISANILCLFLYNVNEEIKKKKNICFTKSYLFNLSGARSAQLTVFGRLFLRHHDGSSTGLLKQKFHIYPV